MTYRPAPSLLTTVPEPLPEPRPQTEGSNVFSIFSLPSDQRRLGRRAEHHRGHRNGATAAWTGSPLVSGEASVGMRADGLRDGHLLRDAGPPTAGSLDASAQDIARVISSFQRLEHRERTAPAPMRRSPPSPRSCRRRWLRFGPCQETGRRRESGPAPPPVSRSAQASPQ